MAETRELKNYIRIYMIFTVALMLIDLTTETSLGFVTIDEPVSFSISGLFNFLKNLFSFLFNLLFYTIPNQKFVNILIWGYRTIIFFEILPYLKDLAGVLPFVD